MSGTGRELGRIACLVLMFSVVACGDEVVPAAPGHLDGGFSSESGAPRSPGPTEVAESFVAECETIDEPNGPIDEPDPHYLYRSTEIVDTKPGQEVRVTKCGLFFRDLGQLYEMPEDNCSSTVLTMNTLSLEVLCHEVEDLRGLPGDQNGELEEVGWKEIHIEKSSAPAEVTCGREQEILPEEGSQVVSIEERFTLVEWDPSAQIAVTRCDCYEDDGTTRTTTTEGCETFTHRRPLDDSGDPFKLVCSKIEKFRDGSSRERGCSRNSFRIPMWSVESSQDD